MTDESLEIVRGSGNLYRDLGIADAEARQLKAILAAEVLKTLEAHGLSTRRAQEITGIDHGDFARVRRARLERFTIERLMTMLERLGQRVEVKVSVKHAASAKARALAPAG